MQISKSLLLCKQGRHIQVLLPGKQGAKRYLQICEHVRMAVHYLVFAERMISIHKKPINMGNLLSPKSISGKIDAWFFDSRRQLSCI